MTAPPAPVVPLLQDVASTNNWGNRFLISTVAFLRIRQLKDGARSRVDHDQRKATSIAVLEVMANTVSWSRD